MIFRNLFRKRGNLKGRISNLRNFGKVPDVDGVFKRPTRHFSHYAIMFIFALVIGLGLFAGSGTIKEKKENPFLFNQTDEKVNEVTYVQSVATIASVVDENMAKSAYEVANKKDVMPTIAMSDDGFVTKTVLSESREAKNKPKNDIGIYIVQEGDTLWTIARKFDLTTDTLRWANGIADENSVKPGQKILIPPVVGVLYLVKDGDTLKGIARRYSASVAMIISQNDLYGESIKPGMRIMIPDGIGPEAPKPQPEPSAEPYAPQQQTQVANVYHPTSGYNNFPYGYCTWYVASRRNVAWSGDASAWYGNAAAAGYGVGSRPVPGSIMVTWESGWGHVAYVESVNGNSWTVSEMNYAGWGITSTRTISPGQVPLIGFVY